MTLAVSEGASVFSMFFRVPHLAGWVEVTLFIKLVWLQCARGVCAARHSSGEYYIATDGFRYELRISAFADIAGLVKK